MDFLVCIDDTDTIDSIGTGTICEMIKAEIIDKNLATCTNITRHQLLIHDDIPYTSHNSSMCFTGQLLKGSKQDIIDLAIDVVMKNHALGSDPGVSVSMVDELIRVNDLISFGVKATREVLTKEQAYKLANDCQVHLSEHGGSGQGIIGALAGIGLRLSGANGELKGVLKKIVESKFTVEDLLKDEGIDRVMTDEGDSLGKEEIVMIKNQTKVMLKEHLFTLLVHKTQEGYVAFNKKEIRQLQLGHVIVKEFEVCGMFKADVDEEIVSEETRTCVNCIYRRWIMTGMACTLDKENDHV